MSKESGKRPWKKCARSSACRKFTSRMVTTVYLHPRRTLVATWSTDADTPVLTTYRELQPGSTQSLRAELDVPPTAVVLSHGWFVHGFPTSAPHLNQQRRAFELEHICGLSPNSLPQIDLECSLPTIGNAFWHTLTCVDSNVVSKVRDSFGPGCKITSDVYADIRAALFSVPPQSERWLLFGRRGDRMVSAIIGIDHRPERISTQPVVEGLALHDAIIAEFALLRQSHGVSINHVLLFGDHLTIGMFETLKLILRQSNIKSARLQPFRAVGSELDTDSERRIIDRAHVVAPIMAAILTDI